MLYRKQFCATFQLEGSRVDAHILLVRGGARALMGSDQACNDLLSEQLKLHVDKGENLHRILLKDDQIKLNRLRSALPNFFPSGIESLTTDAYKYFEPNKNGFSYQGSRQVPPLSVHFFLNQFV